MRRRRRRKRTAELTPLIDVLFILLFASLIQARSTVDRAAAVRDEAPVDAGLADAGVVDAALPDGAQDAGVPGDAALLDASGEDDAEGSHLARSRQVAEALARVVRHRDVFTVDVTAAGHVIALARWQDGIEVRRDRARYRLLRALHGSDDELEYRGRDEPALRVCTLVRQHFEADTLEQALVFVILDAPRDELPLALERGLHESMNRCWGEAGGVGIVLDLEMDRHETP